MVVGGGHFGSYWELQLDMEGVEVADALHCPKRALLRQSLDSSLQVQAAAALRANRWAYRMWVSASG